MKKTVLLLIPILLLGLICGCTGQAEAPRIAATTLPVYQFTFRLCQGTDLTVTRLVTESVSCLHDYTLQVSQMRAIESAQAVLISGAHLEEFMEEALEKADNVIDASADIDLLPGEDHADPHIWLSPANAKIMAQNLCAGLKQQFPEYGDAFDANLTGLLADLDALQRYGEDSLKELSCRELITFHDGFAYFARAFDLTILAAVEEESGSEASAEELTWLIGLVKDRSLPAIFTETNGSDAAARVIAAETGAGIYTLDMAMSGDDYFEAMYHNIDTIKEALG